MTKKRALQLLALVAAAGIFFVLSRSWPHGQTLHVVLGDAAPRVTALRIAYGEAAAASGVAVAEWSRQVTFPFSPGAAPRIVTHEPKLPNGDYVVQIEIEAEASAPTPVTVTKRVKLEGGTTSIDVSRSVPE